MPLQKIKKGFLTDIDKLIKSAIKEIIGLPMDTPDTMLYSSRKVRGLGIMKASWEAYLQSINICNRLKRIGNIYLEATRNFDHEINESLQHLGSENANPSNVRFLRKTL